MKKVTNVKELFNSVGEPVIVDGPGFNKCWKILKAVGRRTSSFDKDYRESDGYFVEFEDGEYPMLFEMYVIEDKDIRLRD